MTAATQAASQTDERAVLSEDAPVAAGSSGWARMPAMLRRSAWFRRREIAVAVSQGAVEGMARLGGHVCDPGCLTGCPLPADEAHSSWFIWATADQVRVARALVRARLAGHPARDDAVLVTSELTANSVAHSASGRQSGGMILVHVAEVSATHAAVLICERRGPGRPAATNARADSESGRGLAVVRSLSWLFRVHDGRTGARTILVVVPAGPPLGEVNRRHARSTRRPSGAARRNTT